MFELNQHVMSQHITISAIFFIQAGIYKINSQSVKGLFKGAGQILQSHKYMGFIAHVK